MHSIRTKITLLAVCAIVVAMTAATLLGVIAVRKVGSSSSDQMLLLLCETGEKNLDSYFESVEQSVEMVSAFIAEDLNGLETDAFAAHVDRARTVFEKTAVKTNGVLTYYYRIDPAVSDTVKGFWYTNLDGNGFAEHEVTDITLYDTDDTSSLVWFTVPKATGKPIWLTPYITDNLDVRVLSYNEPIYYEGTFVGVVGIEIDYSTMAEQVDNIKLYDNGIAFINDDEGKLIYHPLIDVVGMEDSERPTTPYGVTSSGTYFRYSFEGVEKQAVWLPLSNGMRLNVSVPVSEINRGWRNLMLEIFGASVILLAVFILLAMRLTGHITKPLRELTEVAEQMDAGNYEVRLDYNKDDEVGILSNTFNQLADHLKVYIDDLNSLAYADALTSVHNKGAYDIYIREMQATLGHNGNPEFAIGVFDCDKLKNINDSYGHEKGDIYLKTSSALICRIFSHSPVFRTGGDEFAVVLLNNDYKNREQLIRKFRDECLKAEENAENPWEQVRVSMGFAVYDPDIDLSVTSVMRRADKLMYDNKKEREA